jgi:predicted RNA-binding protein with PUA-like domain
MVVDDGLWLSPRSIERAGLRVDFAVEVLERVVELDELRTDDRFGGAEVIRAPRVSSPIAVTPGEWAAVLERARME